MSGPVSQIIGMCDEWNTSGSIQELNLIRTAREGWDTALPRGIIVVGHTKELSDSDDKRRSFELFRRRLHGIEILNFDELLVRAQDLVSLEEPEAVTSAIASASSSPPAEAHPQASG